MNLSIFARDLYKAIVKAAIERDSPTAKWYLDKWEYSFALELEVAKLAIISFIRNDLYSIELIKEEFLGKDQLDYYRQIVKEV